MNAALRAARTLSAVAFIIGSGAALASPVFLSVGQTKVVNLANNVRSARAIDDKLVEVKKKSGGQVVLRGLELGRTELRLRMSDGEEYTLQLHVVPEGTVVYTTGRGGDSRARFTRTAKAAPATATAAQGNEVTPARAQGAPSSTDSAATSSSDAEGDRLEAWAKEPRR